MYTAAALLNLLVWTHLHTVHSQECLHVSHYYTQQKICKIDKKVKELLEDDSNAKLQDRLSTFKSAIAYLTDVVQKIKNPDGRPAFIPPQLPSQKECPYTFVSYKYSCYKAFDFLASWPAAKLYCKLFGADLVTIDSQQKHDFIQRELDSNHVARRKHYAYWINGADFLTHTEWCWFDRKDGKSRKIGPYSNWASGRPDDDFLEDCLEIHFWFDLKWNNVRCDHERRFICEKK